jgi:hypothetical protein
VIVELIDHTIAIAELNDRNDLAQRLAWARERIVDPQIRVVIAGQLKQGKSQLLNSLLNLPVASRRRRGHRGDHRRQLWRPAVGSAGCGHRAQRRTRCH